MSSCFPNFTRTSREFSQNLTTPPPSTPVMDNQEKGPTTCTEFDSAPHTRVPSPTPPETHTHPKTCWTRYKPGLVLQNSGSTARDHLASERTFLAYVRTSLALASTGVALVQLFTIADLTGGSSTAQIVSRRVRAFARPLGATTVIFALCVLAIGLVRYFIVQSALTRGLFPTARTSIVFITLVLTAIVAIMFGVLLSGRTR